eukprot:TRINITY_DN2398_c0_g1_i2.p1 TRINITY_DN2398_c0_g1~~TRINITY_DN2398_c0_g1_i2.p1  ORF type:complete len:542 (-),score=88.83 TRINITY_DN2398_c0_g1_i2:1181-2806(-)
MGVPYRRGSFQPANLCQLFGSVLPYSLPPALLVGALAAVVKYCTTLESMQLMEEWLVRPMSNNVGFTAYTAFVSFLVTFRTGKAYDRFWNGANYIKKMQAEFFVTGSNLVAFNRASGETEKKRIFQHTLIRLLSMLHGVALHQLEYGGDGINIAKQPLPKFELIDAKGLDFKTLEVLANEECRVELIMQWVQSLTVDGIKAGVCTIAPPILSRIFQNLSNALTAYYSAYRVTEVPYPFPYVQTTELVLLIHMISAPVMMQSFASNEMWAFIIAFIPVFLLLSVNFIAAELENPFISTPNVLNMKQLQREFNKRMLLLVKSTTNNVPVLSEHCTFDQSLLGTAAHSLSFSEVWEAYTKERAAQGDTPGTAPVGKVIVESPVVMASPPASVFENVQTDMLNLPIEKPASTQELPMPRVFAAPPSSEQELQRLNDLKTLAERAPLSMEKDLDVSSSSPVVKLDAPTIASSPVHDNASASVQNASRVGGHDGQCSVNPTGTSSPSAVDNAKAAHDGRLDSRSPARSVNDAEPKTQSASDVVIAVP